MYITAFKIAISLGSVMVIVGRVALYAKRVARILQLIPFLRHYKYVVSYAQLTPSIFLHIASNHICGTLLINSEL